MDRERRGDGRIDRIEELPELDGAMAPVELAPKIVGE
jgi:hypothetical protein